MQAARFGRIINIGSEAGRLGSRGGSVYAAAKGGVIAFTQSIARENGRKGITANVIAPSADTRMTRSVPTPKDPAAAMRPLSIWIWQPMAPFTPGAWMVMNTHEGSPR